MANLDRTALPPFPKLIFLDTNVVQNLSSFGELIYDRCLSHEMERKILNLDQQSSEDIFALQQFMVLGQRVAWPIAVSISTLDELAVTPQAHKRVRLLSWGMKLYYYYQGNSDEIGTEPEEATYSELNHFTAIQRSRLAEMLNDLPQEADRQLVIDARECGCDIFLTMDYKTIWRHRECVNQLGLTVMRPVEVVEYIRPWAGLLA